MVSDRIHVHYSSSFLFKSFTTCMYIPSGSDEPSMKTGKQDKKNNS